MEFLHIIIMILVLINIYLVYKTSCIEKLSEDLPSVEHFESSNISTIVNEQYISDMNDIKFISSLAQKIINEEDTLNIQSNKINFTNVKMDGSLKIDGNLIVDGNIEFINKNQAFLDIIPRYMILPWGGTDKNIPLGWTICDGQRYKLKDDGTTELNSEGYLTPDLRGRFIISTGITKDPNNIPMTERLFRQTGGQESVTLTLAQIPPHSHRMKTGRVRADLYFNYHHNFLYNTRGGDNIFTTNEGGGQAHTNMPPFYVLVYIMKL